VKVGNPKEVFWVDVSNRADGKEDFLEEETYELKSEG